MAITRAGSGTAVGGTGSLTPAYPSGVAAGRVAVLKASLKPDTGTINTPTGFTAFPGTNGTGGTGTTGIDTGPMRVALFYRVLDGSESGTVTVSFSGNNNELAVIDIYAADGGFDTAAFAGTTGGDATHGTAWSATGAAGLGLAAGDVVAVVSACCSNSSNNLTVSSRSLAASGATIAAVTDAALVLTNSGNDSSLDWCDAAVTAGTSSAAPTYTATHSASNSGVTAFARLVEDTTPPVSGAGKARFGFAGLAAGLPTSPGRVVNVDFNDAGDMASFTEEMVSTPDNTVTPSVSGGEGVFAATAAGAVGVNDRRLFLYDTSFQPANVDLLARFGRVVGAPGDTQRGFVARVKVADASLGQAPIHWTNVIFGADGHSITGVWEWPTDFSVLHTNQTGANGLYSPAATVTGAGGTVTVTLTVPHLVQSDHIVQVVSPGLGLNVQVSGGITVVDDFTFSFANATTGTDAGYFQWLFTPTGARTWMRMRLHSNVITTKYWMDGHPQPADGDTLRTTTTTLATTLLSGAALKTDGGRVGFVVAHMGKDSQVLVDNLSAVDLAVRGVGSGSFGGSLTGAGTGRALGAGTAAFGGTFVGAGTVVSAGIAGRTATLAENASTTTITGTLPPDRQAGDCVVAVYGMSSTVAGFTGPGGDWVELVAPFTVSVDRLLAAYLQFDPSSGPVGTQSVAGRATCICQAYGGVDPSTPIDVAAVTATAAGTPVTVGSITTATDGARLVGAAAADSAGSTITCPGSMTPLAESTGSGRRTEVADEARPTAGATGTRQWTLSAGALAMLAFSAALRPAADSGTVTGSATGTFGGTLAAAGVGRALATAAGQFGGTFAALGVGRAVATAAGSFGGTFTASGVGRVVGSGAGAFGATFTATGHGTAVAAGSGLFGGTLTALGVRGATGTAAATFGPAGTGTAVRRSHGAATGLYGGVFVAVGSVQGVAVGTGTGQFGFVATSLAVVRVPAAATAAFGGGLTAAGVGVARATATGTFGFTATAAGLRQARSVAATNFGFAATAAAVAARHGAAAGALGFVAVALGHLVTPAGSTVVSTPGATRRPHTTGGTERPYTTGATRTPATAGTTRRTP